MSIDPRCMFCNASSAQRRLIVTVPHNDSVGICDLCIAQAARVLIDLGGKSYTFWLGAEAEAL